MKQKSSNKATRSPAQGYGAPIVPGDPEPNVEVWDAEIMAVKPVEEQVKLAPRAYTFFSRYREDELLMSTATTIQVGQNKWKTIPAKVVKFRDRAIVTNDKEKIDFIRAHHYYGRQIFEFGVPAHDKKIAQVDDAGRIIELEKLGRLGRIMASRSKE